MGKQYFLFILLFISAFYSFGQGGFISGTVKDSLNSEAIVGGVVTVVGRSEGIVTDIDGKFVMPIDTGVHILKISSDGYRDKIFPDIIVKSGETTIIDFPIAKDQKEEEKQVLKTVSVVGVRNSANDIAVVNEIRKENNVVSGISAEQISRSQDVNAAEASRRIPGVTIIDSRFVMVRGLSQRYNAVLLNNVTAPSSESDSKAFSFDIIPSGVIDRIMIYKSPAPELPGEFAGGAIKVYTRNVPLNNSFLLNYSASYRQNTTFSSFYEQKHGKNAWLGYDKTYNLPEQLPNPLPFGFSGNPNEKEISKAIEVNKQFNNNWIAEKGVAMPDQRLSFCLNRRINISKKIILGSITSGNYSNTRSYYRVFREALFDIGSNETVKGLKLVDRNYEHSVRTGLMQNFSLFIGSKSKIDFKNIYNHLQSSSYLMRRGMTKEQDWTPVYAYQYFKGYGLKNVDRSIYSSQLNGSHELGKSTKVNYTVGYSRTVRNEPDSRRYLEMREYNTQSGLPTSDWKFLILDPAYYQVLGRVFDKTDENIKTISVNIEQSIPISKKFVPKVKAGIYLENKKRDYNMRIIGVFSNNRDRFDGLPMDSILLTESFQSDTGLFYGELNNKNFSYSASSKQQAAYLAFNLPFSESFNVYTGLRIEQYRQYLFTYNPAGDAPVIVDTLLTSFLPSINMTYDLNDRALLRLSYGKSLNRPEFRELAETYYYDFETATLTYGNPNLKTPVIHNFDFRYEIYPNPGETFSFGIFYKKFINPIESVYMNASNGIQYSYANALSSRSIGCEVEMRKNLGSLFKKNNFLDYFSLNLNAAYINSEVKLGRSGVQKSKRPMAGQSPYIVNAGLFYSDDSTGLKVSMAYNIIGRRISLVGNYVIPEVYEMPRHSLDLSFSKTLKKHWELQGGVQNLLNARYRFIQDQNRDNKFDKSGDVDNIFTSYRRGTYYTLGITFNF